MSILVLPFLRHQLTVSQLVGHRVFVVGWLNFFGVYSCKRHIDLILIWVRGDFPKSNAKQMDLYPPCSLAFGVIRTPPEL